MKQKNYVKHFDTLNCKTMTECINPDMDMFLEA